MKRKAAEPKTSKTEKKQRGAPDDEPKGNTKEGTTEKKWQERFDGFMERLRNHIAEYLKLPKTEFNQHYSKLEVKKTKQWAKIAPSEGAKSDGLDWEWPMAFVDLKTGDVYQPASGAVNRKTAHPKGNIFDDQFGLGMLEPGYLRFKAKTPVLKPKSERKSSVKSIVNDPTPYLGRVFVMDHGSYSPPAFKRIVGWTSSKKRVRLESVPSTYKPGDTSVQLDRKWLADHPITAPRSDSDDLAILRSNDDADEDDDDEDGGPVYLVYESQQCYLCDSNEEDLNQNYSWCEY